MFQNTAYIRDVYLFNKHCVNGVLEHGGTMFYRLKMGRASLQHMKYHYSQRKITSNQALTFW